MEAVTEENHKTIIIEQMTSNHSNKTNQSMMTLTGYSQWNWTPHDNSKKDHYLLRKKSNDKMRSSALHVESQDTCQGTVE